MKSQNQIKRQIGTLSALTLSGKPILLESQQQQQSVFRRNQNRIYNPTSYSPQPLIIQQTPLPPRTSAGIRSHTSLKQSSSIDSYLGNIESISKQAKLAAFEERHSFNELSPELLQTVQMRHGCEVEIKEEVIHENNLSINVENVDLKSSIQDFDRENGSNHITIIKQGTQLHSKTNSTSIKNNHFSNTQYGNLSEQRVQTSNGNGVKYTTIPLLYKQQNPTMMSKFHCNSTSMMMNLQQTAIVGTKLALQSASISEEQQVQQQQQQQLPLPILSVPEISILKSPSQKRTLKPAIVTQIMIPPSNQKLVSMLPPLKKNVSTASQLPVPAAQHTEIYTQNPVSGNGNHQIQNQNEQTIYDKPKFVNKQQLSKIKQQSTNSAISIIQFGQQQPVSKNSSNPKISNASDQNAKIENDDMQKNSSENKISNVQKNHQKLFSRTSFNQNGQNLAISSTTTINQSSKQQVSQPIVSSPIVTQNSQSTYLKITQSYQSPTLQPAQSAVISSRKKIEEPKMMQISQPVLPRKFINNTTNSHSIRKEEVLSAERSSPKKTASRPQNQSIYPNKKESTLIIQTSANSNALNKTTIIGKPPLPQNITQNGLFSPQNAVIVKQRISAVNETSRPQSKHGLLSGSRFQNIQPPQQSSVSPKKNPNNSLNQTITKFSSRNKSLAISENPKHNAHSEANLELQTRSTNQIDKQNRYIESQTTPQMIADDSYCSSSEESDCEFEPEEMSKKLKEIMRSDEVMDFSHYIAIQIQKKRERLIKNSFSSNVNSKRQGPNNTTYYEHIGYCPADQTDKFRIHGTHQIDSTRASSAPESSEAITSQPGIYKSILRDQLRIFEDAEIDQIIEQAQLKNQPTGVFAKQWAIAEVRKGVMLYGKDNNIPNEIASQTKIMTSYVVMKLVEELEIFDLKNFYLRVTKKAERVIGTKAGLVEGQMVTIYDCLHGLMLPSGNDAAIVLATAFGKYLHFMNLTEKRKNLPRDAEEDLKKALLKHSNLPLKRLHEASSKMDNMLYIQAFVQEMRRYSKLMKIDDTTNFTNPHGLSDKNNHSSPADVCKIASVAMKNKLLKEIVSRRYHECTVLSRELNINLLQWFNSNKLLNDYFIGLKTGTTPSAGPCLCGYFQYGDFSAIVCLMNTKTVDTRWRDMAILCLWALDKHIHGQGIQVIHRESLKDRDERLGKK